MSNLVLSKEVKSMASPALLESIDAVAETLASVENPRIPNIHFKDAFTMSDGEKPVESFEATILFVKNANFYYEGRYNANNPTPPACASSDGIYPDYGEKLQHDNCKDCPRNKYKEDGSGKECRNKKVVYVRIGSAIIPKKLSIPPTSIKFMNNYLLNLASTGKQYSSVVTRFEAFKVDQAQSHMNVKLTALASLTKEETQDNRVLKDVWMNMFKGEKNEEE